MCLVTKNNKINNLNRFLELKNYLILNVSGAAKCFQNGVSRNKTKLLKIFF